MTDIELHAALVTILLPACATAVGLCLAMAMATGRPTTQGLAVALTLAIGITVADVGIRGWQNFWPADITRRLPYVALLVVAASAVALAAARAGRWRTSRATILSSALAAGGIASVFALSPPTSELPPLSKGLWWGTLGTMILAGQVALGQIALRRPGVGLPLLLAACSSACAVAVAMGGSLSLGQICGGFAVCLTVLAAFAWRQPWLAANGTVGQLSAAVLGATLAAAHLFAELPLASALTLHSFTVVPWLGEVPGFRHRPLIGWCVQAAILLALAAVAIAIVLADRPAESSVYG
jgi:hypothetical protein